MDNRKVSLGRLVGFDGVAFLGVHVVPRRRAPSCFRARYRACEARDEGGMRAPTGHPVRTEHDARDKIFRTFGSPDPFFTGDSSFFDINFQSSLSDSALSLVRVALR